MHQNSAAIVEIEDKIVERQATLASLEKEITALEEKKKQKEAELPSVKLDLDALNRSLSILRGIECSIPEEPTETPTFVSGSHTDIARRVLLEHGEPLRMPALLAKAEAIKPGLNKRSFASNVYRLASEGKVFKVDEMQISLLEWENGKGGSSELHLT